MQKLKGLLPSLRERKRYIVFEVISKKSIQLQDLSKSIYKSLLQLFGETGAAKTGMLFIKDKYKNNKGIIRTNHKQVNKVKSALSMIQDINHIPVILRTKGTSGILKKTQKFILWRGEEEKCNQCHIN